MSCNGNYTNISADLDRISDCIKNIFVYLLNFFFLLSGCQPHSQKNQWQKMYEAHTEPISILPLTTSACPSRCPLNESAFLHSTWSVFTTLLVLYRYRSHLTHLLNAQKMLNVALMYSNVVNCGLCFVCLQFIKSHSQTQIWVILMWYKWLNHSVTSRNLLIIRLVTFLPRISCVEQMHSHLRLPNLMQKTEVNLA